MLRPAQFVFTSLRARQNLGLLSVQSALLRGRKVIICSAKVKNPQDVHVSVTLLMPIDDWKKIIDLIPADGYPYWKVRELLSKVVNKISDPVILGIEELQ